MFLLVLLSRVKEHFVIAFSSIRHNKSDDWHRLLQFFPMECNFRWKICRQSQNDNAHIFMVRAGLALIVEMTSKKIFRNRDDVAFTPHFFFKNVWRRSMRCWECTEKVQAWKLFSGK